MLSIHLVNGLSRSSIKFITNQKCNYHLQHIRCLSHYSNRIKKIKDNQKARLQNKKDGLKLKLKEKENLVKQKLEGLRENIFTVPNGLTSLRIVMTPFLGYFILHNYHHLALYTFAFAGITDLLDGYIARKYPKQRSFLGSILDPVADKLLISTMFITMTMAGTIPIYLTVLIFTRDLILLSCGFYIRYLSIPSPRTLNKFFNPSLATVQISPTFLSKLNTAIQLTFIAYCLVSLVYVDLSNVTFFDYFCKSTATSTVISGLSYLFTKNTYKFKLK